MGNCSLTVHNCSHFVCVVRNQSFLLNYRVRSAQQFQALQAQYANFDPKHQFHYPENHTGEAAEAHMANSEPTMVQMEPANLTKRTVMLFE